MLQMSAGHHAPFSECVRWAHNSTHTLTPELERIDTSKHAQYLNGVWG